MKQKIPISILGTGLVASDLLVKVIRSPLLECVMFSGHREDSPGIKRAKDIGIKTSTQSISAIPSGARIVFDCTNAHSHLENGAIFNQMDKFIIDLTPSRAGKMCIPLINLNECLKEWEVNLVSCGGQAMAPIVKTIMEIYPEIEYMELVSTIASKSAGLGTRENIDEYTQTTADVLEEVAGVPKAKAIVILNPAEPPIKMRNTLYTKISPMSLVTQKADGLNEAINETIEKIKTYIPGYKLEFEPTYEHEEGRLTITTTVDGRGDYLPKYAGNLDIITSTAIKVAEEYARH